MGLHVLCMIVWAKGGWRDHTFSINKIISGRYDLCLDANLLPAPECQTEIKMICLQNLWLLQYLKTKNT